MDDIWMMQNDSNSNKILMMPSSQSQTSSQSDSHWNMYSILNPGQISGNFGRLSGITTGSSYSQQIIAAPTSASLSTSSTSSLLSSHHHHHHHQQQQHPNIHSSLITKRSDSTTSINDTINTTTSTGATTATIATAIKNMVKIETKTIDTTILGNSVKPKKQLFLDIFLDEVVQKNLF
ncbi:unnamed protein product [Acanthocheilonema viteae]|uniref:Uncharacterized protein n=1 Tax=Acanthocheilonema viteae TaxID=6277 RepID=A0A498SNT3_ACAVI|nr:unnamed protein product [Acanthocheilonema viteae]